MTYWLSTSVKRCILLSRIIPDKLNSKDIFNTENETFPQAWLLENEYSVNLPAHHYLKEIEIYK